jgi:hypothetical protein
MRKIKTEIQIQKTRRRNNIIMGIAMIAILMISTLGYSLMSNEEEKKSKTTEFGMDFFYENGLWKISFQDKIFGFQYLPSEISTVEKNISINLGTYSGNPLYIVSPNEGLSEILNNIGDYALRYQEACLVNTTCQGDLPQKTCENNIIIFETGNETRVYQKENCVFIVGDSVKGADAFLYSILGVN